MFCYLLITLKNKRFDLILQATPTGHGVPALIIHSFLFSFIFQNNSQNSTVQVTLYNADARLQVLVICSYINSFSISMGYSASGYHAAIATASSP